ncbi:phage integrase Arm DNA-binding domain-containing protein [Marinobacterium sedimentorum]|uniref:phage integrase Arm DNA-binding domain-containing protein n=1 Tax=Marinobacterium sedimentorum TaxID=2927804 RepID=UPI0020C5C392|nr:phage integrase Arm DNA-binding domain-containing protein [Marinobacterium sedimentorum]MCP8687718.1 tyrosine-type recombinase/integrase [Marinobacterium sedimentorum]
MAARRRSNKNRDLEPNLHEYGGYYKYRHPQTGKYHGMGKDKRAANAAARKLNSILLEHTDYTRRILTADAVRFADVIKRYRNEYLPTKKLKPRTLEETNYRLNRLEADLGDDLACDMSVKRLADYLDGHYKNNAYVKHRGLLVEIFRFALTKGLAESNPAEDTLAKTAAEKQRRPLSKAWFDSIHALAPEWLQIAMDFALVSLQRRSDLCAAKFGDIQDEHLYLVQRKTEKYGHRAHLRISIGPSLDAVFKRSRRTGVPSPFIIHRRPEKIRRSKETEHWTQVRPQTLSKAFAEVRDQVKEIARLPAEQRPTLHEIRALGGHLYLEAGFSEEYVQTLMGHSSAKMTAHYTDRHIEWTVCEAALPL